MFQIKLGTSKQDLTWKYRKINSLVKFLNFYFFRKSSRFFFEFLLYKVVYFALNMFYVTLGSYKSVPILQFRKVLRNRSLECLSVRGNPNFLPKKVDHADKID